MVQQYPGNSLEAYTAGARLATYNWLLIDNEANYTALKRYVPQIYKAYQAILTEDGRGQWDRQTPISKRDCHHESKMSL